MTVRPALGLAALSAASWAAVIAVDAANLPAHVWTCCLAVATASTITALQTIVVAERNRAMTSLTEAALTRPFYRDQTGPQPVLPQPASLDERRQRPASPRATAR